MQKILKYTYAGNPTSPYFQPIEQIIECSESETFENGINKPMNPKWHSTLQAMEKDGILIMASGAKYELLSGS